MSFKKELDKAEKKLRREMARLGKRIERRVKATAGSLASQAVGVPGDPIFGPHCGFNNLRSITKRFPDGYILDGIEISFSDACRHHDQCYDKSGKAWAECNAVFLSEMYAECYSKLKGEDLKNCKDFAYKYYYMCTVFGKLAYEKKKAPSDESMHAPQETWHQGVSNFPEIQMLAEAQLHRVFQLSSLKDALEIIKGPPGFSSSTCSFTIHPDGNLIRHNNATKLAKNADKGDSAPPFANTHCFEMLNEESTAVQVLAAASNILFPSDVLLP